MPLSPGTRFGHHEILSSLGAGGMGEVYRASDTRLKRQVAIKILPPAVAQDPARLARFQREAEILASLNHPHIAAIYGLEEANGVSALVMELVDGPTLADRIARGPIPIEEALPIATQIAEALEAAHEQGIVHRDLKPANIKLREDGAVKVLDFGLAKARGGEPLDAAATMIVASSPTIAPIGSGSSQPARGGVSEAGAIVGTAAYMSPEQARGQAVDKRTDVWAFGAVLYEMLSGTPAFAGESVSDVIAAVLKTTPDWSALPPDVPPPIVTLIQRCLEKDRRTRIGDIAVARFVLSGDATTAAPLAAIRPPSAVVRGRQLLPWIATAAVVGALAGWLLPRRSSEAPPVTHLQMDLQPAANLAISLFAGERPARISIALTPDGRRVLFVGSPAGSPLQSQVYERSLDRAAAAPLAGTDGATALFLSPDAQWVGFVADNKIKKAPVAGGAVATVCDLPAGPFWGASWGEDGNVFFGGRGGLFKVTSAGGTPTAIKPVEPFKGDRQLLPQLLPGGKALLFSTSSNIVLLTFGDGAQRTLIEGGTDARYVETGHLVYMKSGTLMAVPFDLTSLQITGAPVALIEGVMHGVNSGNGNDETEVGQFSISRSGTLAYATGGIVPNRKSTLTWVDRRGVAQPLAGASGGGLNPRLSPDGRRIALAIRRERTRDTDIWVHDIERGTTTRLTPDGGSYPLWSPDGARIVYAFGRNSAANLYMINADGSGKPERLTTSDVPQTPTSWSPGANAVAFLQRPTPDTFGIYVLPMEGPSARKPSLFLESRDTFWFPEFSPDGRWMAYVTAESGRAEVYVQPYPGPGAKIQVSTAYGAEPIWTARGRELLFRGATPTEMPTLAAGIESSTPLRVGVPRVLFVSKNGEYDRTVPDRAWDATADGQHLLLVKNESSGDKPVTSLHVVLNWTEELRRRVK